MNKEAKINKELIKVLKEKIQLLEDQKEISRDIINTHKEQLNLSSVSQSVAEEWGKFIIICEREGRPLLLLEDYIEQYCGIIQRQGNEQY